MCDCAQVAPDKFDQVAGPIISWQPHFQSGPRLTRSLRLRFAFNLPPIICASNTPMYCTSPMYSESMCLLSDGAEFAK